MPARHPEFGSRAPAILARYPWSSYPSPYTAAYMIGDIWTDSGFLTGIGGCPEQNLAAQFAATTPTFFYQFDDLHAPGLNNDHPGYQWGAGHAMELAYLWPSFNNGFSLYDLLTPAQLELSRQMVRYWGAFTARGAPEASGQPLWPRLHQRPADVAAAGRPDPDHHGRHLRGRAPVLLLECLIHTAAPRAVVTSIWPVTAAVISACRRSARRAERRESRDR